MKIFGFAGSFRTESFNKKIIRNTLKIADELGVKTEYFDLRNADIPLYDGDLERSSFPKSVEKFKEKIRSADVVLISSPEYNHASPGVLKNVLNWSSRPYGDAAFEGKLVGLMSASPGNRGGAMALIDLKNSLEEMEAKTYPRTINVPNVMNVLDEQGNITDPKLAERIKDFVSSLISVVKK
ncbi:NAD(P)H-dependent oxidoreductase [Patescibacteria group bacterium]|nr:NAD(P)H-dependent oxidoreductase [Patescibacteria group bacterium]